jgi:predicted aconitase with swiveling domain
MKLKGRSIHAGQVKGEALVTSMNISFFGGVDPETGIIMERGHELEGQCIAGKVLVFPTGKGSTVGSYTLYRLKKIGNAPLAIINVECEPITAVGCIISDIPCVDHIEYQEITTGMHVGVDGEHGIIMIPDYSSAARIQGSKKPKSWQSFLKADPLPWLLEPDNPSVRYYTLTELLDRPSDNEEVIATQRAIMATGVVPKLMEGQSEDGYWGAEDSYYTPRYTATAWRFMLLAEFGADGSTAEIRKVSDYLIRQAQLENGGFCARHILRREPGAAGTPCFTGNMVWSYIRLGYLDTQPVQKAIDWILKYSRFDDGDANTWPEWLPQDPNDFCWGRHTCFRGVIAILQALAEIPGKVRSSRVKETLDAGVEYLLMHHVFKHSHNLNKPITQYTQVGFPLFVDNDLLRMLLFLTGLGVHDSRMQEAVDRLVSKQNHLGQWKQQHTYPKTRSQGFMPVFIDPKGQPSKWVTLRALITLKRYYA